MVKFKLTDNNGVDLIGFGITELNVQKLKKGQPILMQGEDVGIPNTQLIIFYGETEAHIAHVLEEFIGPETKTVISDKLKS